MKQKVTFAGCLQNSIIDHTPVNTKSFEAEKAGGVDTALSCIDKLMHFWAGADQDPGLWLEQLIAESVGNEGDRYPACQWPTNLSTNLLTVKTTGSLSTLPRD